MKKKRNILLIVIAVLICLVLVGGAFVLYTIKQGNITSPYYLANDCKEITVNGEDGISITLPRGTLVNIKNRTKNIDDIEYRIFEHDDNTYYVLQNYLVESREDCVLEKELYALRSYTLTESVDSYKITGQVKKNELVSINGYHELLNDGSVDYYFVNSIGYMPSKYLTLEYYETALDSSIYNETYFRSGGDPTKIEYYEKENVSFENNKMSDVVKALYINAEAISLADSYIEIAKQTEGINAFVVDIKDCYVDTQLAYDSPVGKIYAPSTYNIPNNYETYKENVKKLKDAGYYLIGRITAFKDDSFAIDNPNEALLYGGSLYQYGYVKWPSIYSRKMWEYNVALALEAVNDFGFNEIQFDYCRLPEDVEGVDLRNTYDESRIEAINSFLKYATEQLHNAGAYISADVFGETSGDDANYFSAWATAYGQFWPAISNVVDAISSMPYPDHFAPYAYGIEEPWVDVYDLMYSWGKATYFAQKNTYTPAKCRTWIMAQNSDPYDIEYTPEFISEQIRGLKDANVMEGYLTWNAGSSIYKYTSYIDALN